MQGIQFVFKLGDGNLQGNDVPYKLLSLRDVLFMV